jgi:hypothetical protein
MTKNDLIAQCKSENPKMFSTINGEQIELTGADYDAACEAWAEMRFQQLNLEAELADQALAKSALLERLGISEDEATLLLG